MLFRKRSQKRSEDDFQRLRREIRDELGRIRTGLRSHTEPAPRGEPAAEAIRLEAPAVDEAAFTPAVLQEPEAAKPPLAHRLEQITTIRNASVSSSPLIQRAALGQMKEPAPVSNGKAKKRAQPAAEQAVHDATLRLEAVASRLEELTGRLVELTMWLGRARQSDVDREAGTEPNAERRFEPRNGTVELTMRDVPSLHNLMRVGRALSDLAAVADASIAQHERGNAVLHVTLNNAITLDELMAGIDGATTLRVEIEEARPEVSRLRLRFASRPAILNLPGAEPAGSLPATAEAPAVPKTRRRTSKRAAQAAEEATPAAPAPAAE